MKKAELKKRGCEAIDKRAEEIIAAGDYLFNNPELGYKEHKAAALVEEKFKALGLDYRKGLALTGLKARLPGRQSKLSVAVMGEMDAVVCHYHPHADPTTGAAHSCGHNAQTAMMLGAAMGLVDSGVMSELDGDVVFFALPAEEFVELDYRQKLRREGKIKFFGGKQELIALGEFDDVDMAMMCHSASDTPERVMLIPGPGIGSNGFIGKLIKYQGKEAHAGGAPHQGVNALNAAMLGLMGIHANRETFKDADAIRVHPIITKGGDLVNIVPADVRIETYVRGRSIDAIMDASRKVNRALEAGAMAVGAEVVIDEIPGYLPLLHDERMVDLFAANCAEILGEEGVRIGEPMAGSTDMGDITHIMPGIHPQVGGITGRAHARDYSIADPEMAYVVPAKAMAMTVIDLLYDGAELGLQIKDQFKPAMTKEEYLAMWDELIQGK
ncbi:MAG: amidohydrolase [Firmicutes bacterium]|nr:amidohydrolase [Bacillota bacterium]